MSFRRRQYLRWGLVKLGLFDEGAFRCGIDEIRRDDVFIASFPKSGNTWLRFLIANLIADQEEINFRNIDLIVPDIYSAREKVNLLLSPRFIKTHDAYFDIYPKCIYIVRDYRDVLVSYYHYHQALGDFNGTFTEYILRVNHLHPFGKWNEHVNSALSFREEHPDRLLLLRYEDLLSDTSIETGKIIAFSNINPVRSVTEAIHASEFSVLKESEMRKGSQFRDLSGRHFFREGNAGNWKKMFSEKETSLITPDIISTLKKAGYTI